jgi:hypothetical protein
MRILSVMEPLSHRRKSVRLGAIGRWLRERIAPAYDALKADPSRALSAREVRASLAGEHKKNDCKALMVNMEC